MIRLSLINTIKLTVSRQLHMCISPLYLIYNWALRSYISCHVVVQLMFRGASIIMEVVMWYDPVYMHVRMIMWLSCAHRSTRLWIMLSYFQRRYRRGTLSWPLNLEEPAEVVGTIATIRWCPPLLSHTHPRQLHSRYVYLSSVPTQHILA